MLPPEFDFEKILRASERQLADTEKLKARTAELVGRAESADGRVKIGWGPSGDLAELRIDPRAMREGSESLAEIIVEVARAAKQDLQRQLDELTGEVFGTANPADLQPDPAELKETIAGIQDLFTGGLRDANKIFEQMRRNFER
ncbi:YbaB/EbfC DNA-binding family protein [Actinomadura pelletieri DSM 43383]|uniref:YbaB/EbfC DNA-binding family protein n=1 Tax=Actinomadura pelletieri DSM 43383 TaxID=1120940 RepID=A0A495QBC0_9ACTN|nr:YbaB/EbfC family nucleoid-associated protein [Actinomadura pelletieri]RKS68786.1 YbaB/EbfC DNA-binding family protein [Actinomadura pelletieri DSM 43383]